MQSEVPDVDEYVQMQKDIRQEKNQREAIRDAYGDLRIKSMQQVQINDNLQRQKNFGSNAETPVPRKIIGLFDNNNPYRDFGTDSQQSKEVRHAATVEEADVGDRRRSIFASESQASLLGQI